MSKTQRGKRDGTGPYEGSAQAQVSNVGKRQQAGEVCPVKKKVLEPTGLGEWADRRRHGD